MMALAVTLVMQASASQLESAAERIAEHPELARSFEEKSAPFVRCGRKALERHLATGAQGQSFEEMSQEQGFAIFSKAIDGAARECGVGRYAAAIAADIRATLPDLDQASAVTIVKANLIQLIGFSIWGSEP